MWKNDDLLHYQFLLDKHGPMCRGVMSNNSNSSFTEAQEVNDELNRVDVEGFPYRGTCLQLLFVGCIPSGQFQMSIVFWPVQSGFLHRGDNGNFQEAKRRFSRRSYRKHHVSCPVMTRLRNVPSLSVLLIRSLQTVMRPSR